MFDSFLISFTFLFLALWSAQKAGTQDLGGLAGTELLVENASEITRDGMVIAWKEDA